MSNQTRTRKSHSVPVIAYPEGVIVGNVRTGKNSSGKVRHVATTVSGQRIGTFDMYREAADALLAWHRKGLDELRTREHTEPTPARHLVELVDCPAHRAGYGITHLSRYVFTTRKGSSPTRIVVWSNANRPNPRNGQPVRFGEYGKLDGGEGAYLDPSNNATDELVSIRLTPEASCITNNGTNTGTEASGQVYSPAGARIAEGDEITLVYPDGTEVTFTAHFTNNGHGELRYLRTEVVAPTPESPAKRRVRLAAELVTDVTGASADHRYARAYGILAGLVRGTLDDGAEGERAAALAREFVRQMDAAGIVK